MRKLIGYGIAAFITAPVWVPLAFLTYIGYKSTKFAFQYPKTTVAGCALTGLLWYASSDRGNDFRNTTSQVIHKTVSYVNEHASLEHRIAPSLSSPKAISHPQFDFYYVKPDDTLEKIAQHIGGNQAYANVLKQDNTSIAQPLVPGTLLKIRKGIHITKSLQVHQNVPELHAAVIPANQSISVFLQTTPLRTEHILKLNAHLGLAYTDSYSKGPRIVYYD
jgi:hypothetical protein